MNRQFALCIGAVGLVSAAASAFPVHMTINQTSSVLGADVCFDPAVVLTQECDTVASALAGFIEFDFAGPNPGELSVLDFDIEFVDDPSFTLSWGIFGSVDGQLVDGHSLHNDPGVPSPPAAIDTDGSFTATGIPTRMTGTATMTGSMVGTPIDETINLADEDPVDGEATGTIQINGREVLLIMHMPIDYESTDDLGTATITGVISIIASGLIPEGCMADLTNDGIVDAGDLGVFINAYLASDLIADFTGDGIVDAGDLGAFINLFLAGCP